MILIYTTDGKRQEVTMADPEREKQLLIAWYAIGRDPDFAQKKIKITHSTGVLTFQVSKIKDIMICQEATCESVIVDDATVAGVDI